MPLDLPKWIHYFGTSNRLHRSEPEWGSPLEMEDGKRVALAATLAQFQLGDGGGPCRLIARDAERLRDSDEDVRQVIDLWFAEEAEHSRLLSGAVSRLRGTPVTDSLSFRVFNQCRRVFGAQFEMLVLLIVEIVSTAYYRLVRRHCADEPIRQMCRLIIRDEAGHVSFHRERLAGHYSEGPPWWWATHFYLLGGACTVFLWLSHGPWLRRIGGTFGELSGMSFRGLVHFRRRLDPGLQEDSSVGTQHFFGSNRDRSIWLEAPSLHE